MIVAAMLWATVPPPQPLLQLPVCKSRLGLVTADRIKLLWQRLSSHGKQRYFENRIIRRLDLCLPTPTCLTDDRIRGKESSQHTHMTDHNSSMTLWFHHGDIGHDRHEIYIHRLLYRSAATHLPRTTTVSDFPHTLYWQSWSSSTIVCYACTTY